jgi:hypothetical protein
MKQNVQARQEYFQPGILGKVGFVHTRYHSRACHVEQPPPGRERKPDGLDRER